MSLISTLYRHSRTRSNTQWHLALQRRLTIESLERRTMFSIAPGSLVGSAPTTDPGDAVQAGSTVHRALAGLPTAEQQVVATEIGQLSASDGATGDEFGGSVAISGNTIVVGAVLADSNLGAAYVFTEPSSGWGDMTQVAELTASDGVAGDGFGDAVSISGNTIVVGADNASVGANGSQGAAYVFTEPAAGWANMTQTAKLVAPNGQADADFGEAVSIGGNTIIVGADNPDHLNAEGAAYVYTEPSTGWANMTQAAELTASDGTASDFFGSSVSISGNTVVVGAWDANVGANTGQGTAYVFTEPTGGWANRTQTAKLTASDGAAYDYFGISVSISGNMVVVGAFGGTVGTNSEQGAAYVFTEPAAGWVNMTETAKLTASDGLRATFSATRFRSAATQSWLRRKRHRRRQ